MNEAPAQRRRVNPGEMLHGYRVRKALGDGAFSRVYLVEDSDTHTAYALKHVIAENGSGNAFLLQLELGGIDAARGIHGEDQGKID